MSVPKVDVACKTCRKRKVKCTGELPCIACRVARRLCSYGSDRSAPGGNPAMDQYVQSLEDRVTQLTVFLKTSGHVSESTLKELGIAGEAPVEYRIPRSFMRLTTQDDIAHYCSESSSQALLVRAMRSIGRQSGHEEQYRQLCASLSSYYNTVDCNTDVVLLPLSPCEELKLAAILANRSYMRECADLYSTLFSPAVSIAQALMAPLIS